MHFAYITICGLLKALLQYFCNPSVVGVSFHPLVVLTLSGHFWRKESLLNLPIPLTLSALGGGGSNARMTKLTSANQKLLIL